MQTWKRIVITIYNTVIILLEMQKTEVHNIGKKY